MGIIEYLAEIEREEVLEEGRQEGVKKATYRFVENLLKDSGLTLEKIAALADVPLETVKKINVMLMFEQLAEIKRKEVLEECHARYYAEDYSIRFARTYLQSYKVGLQDGFDLATRRLVESLLKDSTYPVEKIASLIDASLEKVEQIKDALHPKQ
jgi:hypothetical protein